jgi:hypothetical protein
MRLVLGAVLVTILAGSAHAQGASASPAAAGASPSPADTSPSSTSPAIADGAAVTPPSAVSPLPPSPLDGSRATANPVAEFLLGGAAGTAGLFAGAFLGWGVHCTIGCHNSSGDNAGLPGLGGLLLGAAIGLTTSTAAVVAYTGSDREHAGSFGWAWLGAAAGGTAAVYAARRWDGEGAIALVIGGAALGSTVVFNLTRTRRGPSTAVRLVPLITGGGVQLALVGAR